MFIGKNLELANTLAETIRFFNQKGWSPATSTNYSVRSEVPTEYIISRSGVDKGHFKADDFIVINGAGTVLDSITRSGVKPSAETEIHTALYAQFPEINCVMHTHSVLGTVISQALLKEQQIKFEGLEILKGLEGNTTHQMEEIIPIVPNSQDISHIVRALGPHFNKHKNLHAFLIEGHGLYTWGKDIATTKRHVETLEFLFECWFAARKI